MTQVSRSLTLDSEFDLDTEVGRALHRLFTISPPPRGLVLDRIFRLLHEIDDPHLKMPPVIHVAGTNGKGSSIAFMRAMFEAAGYRVHVSTSPHLVRFNERIRIAGKIISDADLLAAINEIEAANDGKDISFFEITTVMAFVAFARVPADVVLLETGLGGRLDATNVLDKPMVTAISTISRDHTQFLGEDVAGIAGEKAGIMRPGVPCVIGQQIFPDAEKALLEKAREKGARAFCFGRDWKVEKTAQGFCYQSEKMEAEFPLPGLFGDHQIFNAGLAIASLEQTQGFALRRNAIETGLVTVEWPGRMQRLVKGPLVALLPPGWELWVDGAHNDSGALVAAAQMEKWRKEMPVDVISGLLKTKQVAPFIQPLTGRFDSLHTVAIPDEPASYGARELADAFATAGVAGAVAAESLPAAIKGIVLSFRQPRRIFITGSLYLVGSILKDHS